MATVDWDSSFESAPAGSDNASTIDDKIRELKENLRKRLEKELKWDTGTPGMTSQGWMKEGSAVAYYESSAPSNRPDDATALDSDDAGRLWLDSDDGKLYVYTGSAWDAITPGTTVSDELASLTASEVQQLQNIDSSTISAAQWGYLGGMDQNVKTTSAVTFATVNTGQGANELYDMNQNVKTTNSPTFAGLTLNGALKPVNPGVDGNSGQLAAGATYTLPRGMYIISSEYAQIEAYINGSWVETSSANGGFTVSDGVNVRVKNSGANPYTLYWLKF